MGLNEVLECRTTYVYISCNSVTICVGWILNLLLPVVTTAIWQIDLLTYKILTLLYVAFCVFNDAVH